MKNSGYVGAAVLFILTAILSCTATAVILETKRSAPVKLPQGSSQILPAGVEFQGDTSSPYTLVEFMDYECPPCKNLAPKIDSVVAKYSHKLRFVARHFPLNIHKNALKAAQFAEATREQGKFWQAHYALLNANSPLTDAYLAEICHRLNLDASRLSKDASSIGQTRVSRDKRTASLLGVNSTPTLVLCTPSGSVYRLRNISHVSELIERGER